MDRWPSTRSNWYFLLRLDKAAFWLDDKDELAEGSVALNDGALTDELSVGMAVEVVVADGA